MAHSDELERAARTRSTTTVVTATHGRHDALEELHASLSALAEPPRRLVVVALDDEELLGWHPEDGVPVLVVPLSARPEGVPWAAAKNAGAGAAWREGAELVVFVETGHVVEDGTLAALEAVAAEDGAGMWWADDDDPRRPEAAREEVGPARMHNATFAVSRSGWVELGGFCEDYVGPGFEDLDLVAVADARTLPARRAQGAVVHRAACAPEPFEETDHRGDGTSDGLADPEDAGRSESALSSQVDGDLESEIEQPDQARERNAELFRRRWGVEPTNARGGW